MNETILCSFASHHVFIQFTYICRTLGTFVNICIFSYIRLFYYCYMQCVRLYCVNERPTYSCMQYVQKNFVHEIHCDCSLQDFSLSDGGDHLLPLTLIGDQQITRSRGSRVQNFCASTYIIPNSFDAKSTNTNETKPICFFAVIEID